MKLRPLLLGAILTLLTGGSASAGMILVQGTFSVTEGVRPELFGHVLPGDTFGFSFTYDNSVTESSSGTGLFTNAVLTGGTFQKLSGPGSWSPGPGNLNAGTVVTQNNIESLFGSPGVWDSVSFYPRTSGFANAGDYVFGQLYVPLRRSDLSTVLDGQTLGQQLSGRAVNSLTWLSGPASLDFYPASRPLPLFQAAPGIVTLTFVPEPGSSLILLPGLAVLLRRRR